MKSQVSSLKPQGWEPNAHRSRVRRELRLETSDFRLEACSAVVIAGLALAAFACATNPATGKREFSLMSEAQEIQIGQEADPDIRREMGVYDDRSLQEYVSDIGTRLARVSERPNLPWHFTVVDVPAVNAFALPGGYIYITRGIMAFLDSEAQLAGVLGHEIGHVTARHASQQYSRATGASLGLLIGSIFAGEAGPGLAQLGESGLGLLFLKYSRDDEAEADGLGVRYVSRAGWDPEGIPQMLTTLGRIEEQSDDKGVPNWLLTHPAPEDRVRRVQTAVQQAEAGGTRFASDRDAYLRRIDGMVFGDNPDQGIVRGNSFVHRNLRFALDFPVGWDITNGQTQVSARERGGRSVMVLQLVQRPQGRTLREVALLSMQRSGFRPIDGSATTINGLDAFVGTYEGTLQNTGRVQLRAAHIAQDRNVFLVAGIAPLQVYSRVESSFSQSIRTFRPLSRGEAESVRPNRIDLYTARSGDTWQSIAERQGGGVVKPSTLAIMNDHAATDQPQPGERLKIVVMG
jgi:predicted Zn-dependent protease